MTQGYLAEQANVALSTVRNFETGRSVPVRNNLRAIERAIERHGVSVIAAGESSSPAGVGVRFIK